MDSKKWHASKTVWAGIITVVLATLTAVDSAFGTNILTSPVVSVILALAGALGVYGRTSANTTIK